MMIDWQKIKREVQYFVAALVSVVILLGISLYYHQQHEAEWQQNKRKLIQTKIKYKQSKDREKLLAEYEKKFNELKDSGIYGEEQRIHWIETIQKSTEERRIPSVKFNINQRVKLNRDNLQESLEGIDIHLSKMKLEFELLHEGDLFGLFQDLDREANGLHMVNNCYIKNNTRELSVLESNTRSNFVGHCELLWFTLDEEQHEEEDDS